MARTTLTVTGMTCGHCVQSVEQALKAVPGVSAVGVFLEDGEAEVDHDGGRTTADALIGAVEQAGYRAAVKG